MTKIEIKGLKELKQAFKDLGPEFAKRQKGALMVVANSYKSDVQTITPYLTGTLRRSIHAELVRDDTALVGSNLEYAAPVEYGTGRRQPKPYFRPPIDLYYQKYKRLFLEVMGA